MEKRRILWCAFACICSLGMAQTVKVYDVAEYGLKAGRKKNVSQAMNRLVDTIKQECDESDSIVIRFHEGAGHGGKADSAGEIQRGGMQV